MTYQPLERAGLIEPYLVPQAEIRDLLEVARRDVKTAQELTIMENGKWKMDDLLVPIFLLPLSVLPFPSSVLPLPCPSHS